MYISISFHRVAGISGERQLGNAALRNQSGAPVDAIDDDLRCRNTI